MSGAHLNPAISFAQLLRGAISPLRFLLFIPAQLIGAFLGAALAFLGHFGFFLILFLYLLYISPKNFYVNIKHF